MQVIRNGAILRQTRTKSVEPPLRCGKGCHFSESQDRLLANFRVFMRLRTPIAPVLELLEYYVAADMFMRRLYPGQGIMKGVDRCGRRTKDRDTSSLEGYLTRCISLGGSFLDASQVILI